MSYQATNVSAYVGKKALVKNISLSTKPGVFSVILGPNGAGKSTMLKLLAGDLKPSSGTISLDQKPLGGIGYRERAKRRAILPQSSHVTFNFTAYDIVLMGRLPHDEPPSVSRPILKEIIKLTRTEYLMEQQFSTLSGGEKQRVQFARVLAQIWPTDDNRGHKYLLLDEPTSALDPLYQLEILKIARWLANEKGFGVLAILHDLNQAMSYADQVYLLKEGELNRSGPPNDVLDKETIRTVWGINTEILRRSADHSPVIVATL